MRVGFFTHFNQRIVDLFQLRGDCFPCLAGKRVILQDFFVNLYGAFFTPDAFIENGRFVVTRYCGLQVHPNPVEGGRNATAFIYFTAEIFDEWLNFMTEIIPLLSQLAKAGGEGRTINFFSGFFVAVLSVVQGGDKVV